MKDQTSTQRAIELKIREVAEETPCITFGYIGNFERWGDDRRLYLWIDRSRDSDGRRKHLWSCEAVGLDSAEMTCATRALRCFKEGYEAAKREAEAEIIESETAWLQ